MSENKDHATEWAAQTISNHLVLEARLRGALSACVRYIERERDRWVQDNSPDADEGNIDEDAAPHLAEIDAVLDSARAALRPAEQGGGA